MISFVSRLRGRPGLQAIVLAVATGFSQLLMAATFALVARATTPARFGLATLALSLAGIGVGLIDFGTNEYWLRELARDFGSLTTMFNRLATKLVLNFLLSIAMVAVCLAVPQLRVWWCVGLVLFAMQAEQSMQVPLRAAAHVSVVSQSMMLNRIVGLGAVLLLGMAGKDAMHLLVATSLGSLAASVFMWLRSGRGLLRERGPLRFCNPWAGATRYGVISLSGSLQSLDAPLLTKFAGAAQNGLYGAVNRWTQPIALLITAFSSASVPHVSAARTMRAGWRAIRKSSVLLLGALVVALLVFVFAKPVILLLLGPAYAGSVGVLRILAISTAIVIFNQPAAMMLQSTGHDATVSVVMPVGVGAQLIALILLTPRHGAMGAALAAVVAQIVVAFSLAAVIVRVLQQERLLAADVVEIGPS